MGKKNKEPKEGNPNPFASGSSENIFKSLFGGTQEESNHASVSLFSDSNPYRRKPTNDDQSISQKIQETLRLDVDSPRKNDTEMPDSIDNEGTKKRKRKEKSIKKGLDLDDSDVDNDDTKMTDSLDNEASKKRKRKEKSSKNGLDLDDSVVEGGHSEVKKLKEGNGVGSKSSNLDVDEKKKKKRKRSEIEAEYEERKYGVVNLNSEEGEGEKEKVGEKRKKVDNGEATLVPKEGFDDEEKLLRTVFVGNLPLKVKKKALLREFSQFGEVESIRIRSVPLLDDKTPRKGAIIKKQINDAVDRVNAYIVFKTEESAKASLSHNMAVVGGNHIHVDRACPPRKKLKGENAPLYDNKRTVFIGNLPFDVKDEELYQLFAGIHNLKDSVEAIRVVRDPGTSMGKGIAYVLFKTREAANVVVRKHKLKIRERELRLAHASKPNSMPSKRKDLPSSNSYNSSTKKLAVGASSSSSYQGMRASKSGAQKKIATKIAKPVRTESRSQSMVKRKERTEKRPSVAARKTAANAMRSNGISVGSDGGGKKRKAESHTPQSNSRNKKTRKFG